MNVPFLVGVKVTGIDRSDSGLNGIPADGLSGAANGALMFEVPFTMLWVLPVLETWM